MENMVGCCTHPASAGHVLTADGRRMVTRGALVEGTLFGTEGRWTVQLRSRRSVHA